MTDRGIEISLPLSWAEFAVLMAVAAIAILSCIGYLLLRGVRPDGDSWLHSLRKPLGLEAVPPPAFEVAFLLWLVLGITLFAGVLLAIGETTALALGYLAGDTNATRTAILGLAALMAALGAVIALPFTLIKRHHTERQTKATEEGLVTDRINAAVASLGAEKVVKEVTDRPRFRKDAAGNLARDEDGKPVPETDAEGQPIIDREMREITRPNLEVRIGAILALERLARMNLDVHVQIMQILCAYVRTNAPANQGDLMPEYKIQGPDTEDRQIEHWKQGGKDYRRQMDIALAAVKPREDIVTAMHVIGRRTSEQRRTEAGWGRDDAYRKSVFTDAELVFDSAPAPRQSEIATLTGWDSYFIRFREWGEKLDQYAGYRLDLRNTDLRKHDLSSLNFAGAMLDGAWLQAATLYRAQMQGALLRKARLQRAWFEEAQMQGAQLDDALLQETDLNLAQLQGASFDGAQMHGARLAEAHLQGAWFEGSQLLSAMLGGAQLQGASLIAARLQGAWLNAAKLHGASIERSLLDNLLSVKSASFHGVSLRYVDLSRVRLSVEQINSAFGDASVTRPDGARPGDPGWPKHWPTEVLDGDDFLAAYQAWLAALPPS